MNFLQTFFKSLYSLKTLSLFRFQRIGKTIRYIFALSFLISIPSIIKFSISLFGVTANNSPIFAEAVKGLNGEQIAELQKTLPGILPVIAFLSILFIFLAIVMFEFIGISVVAAAGLIIKNAIGRNLNYQQLWVMSAYTITLPSILLMLFSFFSLNITLPFLLYLALALILIYLTIQRVPKPRIKKQKPGARSQS